MVLFLRIIIHKDLLLYFSFEKYHRKGERKKKKYTFGLYFSSTSFTSLYFYFYIDTKLSPPVNKYRRRWRWRPKGGSFSYFNVLGNATTTSRLSAPLVESPLYLTSLRASAGVQNDLHSSVYFFHLIFSTLFPSFFFSPIRKFSKSLLGTLRHPTFYAIAKPNRTNFCAWLSTLLQNLSLTVVRVSFDEISPAFSDDLFILAHYTYYIQ